MRVSTGRTALESLLAAAIFAVCGGATAAAIFQSAPRWLEAALAAAVATGLAAASVWWTTSLGVRRPSAWRYVGAGAAAGILCHPLYFIVETLVSGQSMLTPSELAVGSMFSLIVAGIITVPAGIVAALFTRALCNRWPRYTAERPGGRV